MTNIFPLRFGRSMQAVTLASLATICLGCESPPSEEKKPEDRFAIDSESLAESREVWIQLPAGYGLSERKYPVLYVLDAEWIINFAVCSVEFLSGELAGRIPEMIVVGIPNTNRMRDLTVSFDSNASFLKFMDFIENELINFIDSTYRTNSHRVIYGWSSGANICLWILITKPHLFQGYIASGTGISQAANDFAETNFSQHSYNWKSLYACSEGDSPYRREALRLLSTLLEKSAPAGLRWQCDVMAEDDHTAVLPRGLLAGLEFLYADCRLPTNIAWQGRAAISESIMI